ncbi:MAG: autotransporter-associated beta strand repeat-containing protein [Akkermansiaceae bacterium]|nr:autotransporter-associated beta strand repeat-containing protein [Akkermansiaceae bacterium]
MSVVDDKPYVAATNEIRSFGFPDQSLGRISGTNISVTVPYAADLTALAPTFTLSPFAKAAPPPGTVRDFSQPQTCTVTAQDGRSQVYTVTVIKSGQPNAFTWSKTEPGSWSEGSKWTNNLADGSAPVPAGRPDYIFNFNMAGNQAVTNPHDRSSKATTSLTKAGSGTWTLSGTNRYSGETKVTEGTLSLANARSLGDKPDIAISEGATLDLNFKGQMKVRKLSIDGKAQAAGTYNATGLPKTMKGTGVLVVAP